MAIRSFSSLNQARAIADGYARATERTMYVVYEAPEFYVATEEDLSTLFVGLADNQIRYCTAERSR
ncbi:MAG: hypothetical protein WBL50_08880 [Candidatus Acidiferrum sp.]